MNRNTYKERHRIARLGNLGTLACSSGCTRGEYQFFLREVYDLRFPHIGDSRHNVWRSFDSLARRERPWYYVRHAKQYRAPRVAGPIAVLP